MKEIWNWIQLALTAVGGVVGWFLGGFDGFMYALIVFVISDYTTGVMCAIVDKKLSSEIGFKGICKKVLIFIMVGIGNIVDVCSKKSSNSCFKRRLLCSCSPIQWKSIYFM